MAIVYSAKFEHVEAHNIGKTDIAINAHDRSDCRRAAVSLMIGAGNLSADVQITARAARHLADALIAAADATEQVPA